MLEIFRNLIRRKLRSGLTISGILIGIFALTTMGALSEHFTSLLNGGVLYFGSNIQVGAPAGQQTALLPLSTMNPLSQVAGVELVVPSYVVQAEPDASGGRFGPQYTIVNQGPPGRDALPLTVDHGRPLTGGSRGEVVLGISFARELKTAVGRTVSLPVRPADAPPTFVNHPFRVVGILAKTGTAPDVFAYVSDADARTLLTDSLSPTIRGAIDINNVAEGFVVYAHPGTALGTLDQIARRITHDVPSVKATEPSGPVNAFRAASTTFTAIVTGAAFLALIIGGLSVVNTMIMSVSERTREIGLKKAVGAHTGAILREYLTEAAVIGLIGGLSGFLLGALVTTLANRAGADSNLDLFLITPRLTFFAIGFAILLGALAGIAPAFRAARLDPVNALRTSN